MRDTLDSDSATYLISVANLNHNYIGGTAQTSAKGLEPFPRVPKTLVLPIN